MSWSSTGNSLAVAFGSLSTMDWCEYDSIVAVWTLFQRGNTYTKKPSIVLDVANEITSLAFHPKVPTLLAGGNYNGDVFLWDVGEKTKDPQLCSSTANDGLDKEPVRDLQWVENAQQPGVWQVVSVFFKL